jgi:uncharacterized membrane protein
MKKKKQAHEHVKRSFVKAITFRVIIVIADTTIVLILTHRYDLAIGFVVLTNIASTILYYLHERVWAHIHWGSLH